MTNATPLNSDILYDLSIVAKDEVLWKRVARYIHKMAHKNDYYESEQFYKDLDKAERDIAEGRGIEIKDIDALFV